MKTISESIPREKEIIETMIRDKKEMREYIKKHGNLKGFKSDNFKFAKPI